MHGCKQDASSETRELQRAIEFLAAGSLILANFDVLVINFPPVLLVKY